MRFTITNPKNLLGLIVIILEFTVNHSASADPTPNASPTPTPTLFLSVSINGGPMVVATPSPGPGTSPAPASNPNNPQDFSRLVPYRFHSPIAPNSAFRPNPGYVPSPDSVHNPHLIRIPTGADANKVVGAAPIIAQLAVIAQAIQDAQKAGSKSPFLDTDLRVVQAAISEVAAVDYPSALNYIRQITPPTADPKDPITIALTNLNGTLSDSGDAYQAAMTKLLATTLEGAKSTIRNAKKTTDLDALSLSLAAAKDEVSRTDFDTFNRVIRQKIDDAGDYVIKYQKFLSDEEDGNLSATDDCLQLIKITSFVPLTHAEILAMAPQAEIIAGKVMFAGLRFQSIDDIPAAYQQMDTLQRSGLAFNSDARSTICYLQGLSRAYQMCKDQNYKGGLQELTNLHHSPLADTAATIPDFPISARALGMATEQLRCKLIIGFINDPSVIFSRPNESSSTFLTTAIEALAKSQSWEALERALQIYADDNQYPDWSQQDLTAISSFIQAQKCEQNGDFFGAKNYYQNAMQAMGKYFPSDLAATKLRELKDSHPDAFPSN